MELLVTFGVTGGAEDSGPSWRGQGELGAAFIAPQAKIGHHGGQLKLGG